MKIKIIILVVVAIATLNGSLFVNSACTAENGACQGNYNCNFGLYCNSVNGKCTKYSDVGQTCNYDVSVNQICYPGLTCTNNTCIVPPARSPGEPCESDTQCYTGKCNALTCASNSNNTCSNDVECAYGYYCKQSNGPSSLGECTLVSGLNGPCTEHNQCQLGLNCFTYQSNNTCQPIFSRVLDQPCTDSTQFFNLDYEVPQMMCDIGQSYSCSLAGTCTSRFTDSYMPECKNSIVNLTQCALQHSCKSVSKVKESQDTCLFRHCKDIICSSPCMSSGTSCMTSSFNYTSLLCRPTPSTTTSSSTSTTSTSTSSTTSTSNPTSTSSTSSTSSSTSSTSTSSTSSSSTSNPTTTSDALSTLQLLTPMQMILTIFATYTILTMMTSPLSQ